MNVKKMNVKKRSHVSVLYWPRHWTHPHTAKPCCVESASSSRLWAIIEISHYVLWLRPVPSWGLDCENTSEQSQAELSAREYLGTEHVNLDAWALSGVPTFQPVPAHSFKNLRRVLEEDESKMYPTFVEAADARGRDDQHMCRCLEKS